MKGASERLPTNREHIKGLYRCLPRLYARRFESVMEWMNYDKITSIGVLGWRERPLFVVAVT